MKAHLLLTEGFPNCDIMRTKDQHIICFFAMIFRTQEDHRQEIVGEVMQKRKWNQATAQGTGL